MAMRQILLLLSYVVFLSTAIFLLPGSIKEHFALDRLHDVIVLNFSTENSIFLATFLMIGVYQLGLAALLLQAASVQILPTRFFTFFGFFFGHYVSGLYSSLRRPVTSVHRRQLEKFDQRAVESRIYGFVVLFAAVMTTVVGSGYFGRLQSSFIEELIQLADLAMQDRLVAAVLFDLLVTWILLIDPISEDMQRRGWSFTGNQALGSAMTALAIVAVPGLGLGAYLTFRPRLPLKSTKDSM